MASIVAGCGTLDSPSPSPLTIPAPTCGGAKILIPGALSCDQLGRLALEVLRSEAPGQLDRGVIAVTVELQGCARNEVPPQLDCTGEDFVQLVTFTFGPSIAGGPVEPSLSVGLAPVSGRLLGNVNPLIR
ncbi:MAG: hypothetical protein C0498_07540 [Anaerolinea sp.]|nr:hypothetical protein [Anaerolinea sp.]MBY0254857.1 hypothetical protein [Methylobacterium organophilum]